MFVYNIDDVWPMFMDWRFLYGTEMEIREEISGRISCLVPINDYRLRRQDYLWITEHCGPRSYTMGNIIFKGIPGRMADIAIGYIFISQLFYIHDKGYIHCVCFGYKGFYQVEEIDFCFG